MNFETAGWLIAGALLHSVAAVACLVAVVWIVRNGDKDRPDRQSTLNALGLTAIWAVLYSAFGPGDISTQISAIIRNLGWTVALYRLFALDGRDQSLAPIRPVIFALGFVEIMQLVLLLVQERFAISANIAAITFETANLFRVLLAVGALVLLHNLYVGASATGRNAVRWSAIGLAMMWVYELNYHTVTYLGGAHSLELASLRSLVFIALAVALALGSNSGASDLRFKPSRKVTFQTLSLLLIGAYLLFMVAVTQSLSMLGGDLGRLSQVGFIVLGSVAALFWLPSKRLRGWVRVTAVKHLFQHRYDYREEWLRFTGTIGRADEDAPPLHDRAVQAVADITDSPAGLLLVSGDHGQMELVARWQWPGIDVPAEAISLPLARLLEVHDFILDLDDVRAGRDRHGEQALVPQWLLEEQRAWAIVPLLHFDRVVALVVLARPKDTRRLDWEDFDLLRIGGRQLASYLAEQAGQEALMEANRFDEFNRRIAFVMHDIKNLASQITLLSRNAEKHADNPDFRADMLVTLRNSSDKLNTLLARLGRYGSAAGAERENVPLHSFVRDLIDHFQKLHPVSITQEDACIVTADREALEQAVSHLLQNAIDASPPESPIFLTVTEDGSNARIEIIDSGEGMSPGFIRNGLFKPFVSSKEGGFGIGAMEARELIRAMGGWLEVESREGLGTRFVVSLPMSVAGTGAVEQTAIEEKVA